MLGPRVVRKISMYFEKNNKQKNINWKKSMPWMQTCIVEWSLFESTLQNNVNAYYEHEL